MGDNGRVVSRWLAGAAVAWVAGFTMFYLALIRSQGNTPAWWLIAVLVAAAIPLVLAAAARPVRPALFAATLLLAPAVAAATAVTVRAYQRPAHDGQPAG